MPRRRGYHRVGRNAAALSYACLVGEVLADTGRGRACVGAKRVVCESPHGPQNLAGGLAGVHPTGGLDTL